MKITVNAAWSSDGNLYAGATVKMGQVIRMGSGWRANLPQGGTLGLFPTQTAARKAIIANLKK